MPIRPAKRERRGGERAVATFALSAFAVVLVLGAAGVLLLERTGRHEAIRDAKDLTKLAGRGIVAPDLTQGVLRGRPAALAALDRIVRTRVVVDPVVRVKVWDADGRIVYSDEPRLIGETYGLREDERRALEQGTVAAEVSDLRRPENRFERHWHKLLEVYMPIRGPGGRPLLFESYLRFSSVSASGRRLLLAFAPALIGALLLLWLLQMPLAWRLARRLRAGQREREGLLRRAIESSDLERRRVARDLHDGAVQNLAGIAYSLAAAAGEAPPDLAPKLSEAADETRRTIRELRSLLVEIYPPDLHRTGLEAALRDLLAPFAARGIEAALELQLPLEVAPELEALFFRAAQEALRNVLAHARAKHVAVTVDVSDRTAVLVVSDDGRGFVPEEADTSAHFGVRLLDDISRDAGGTLQVTSTPGAGTTMRLVVPLP
jgi:two-component system, NarL family, sensor kinase